VPVRRRACACAARTSTRSAASACRWCWCCTSTTSCATAAWRGGGGGGEQRALVERCRALLASRGHKRLAARALHNDDALISMGERWGFVRAWEWMLYE
jgi:hypothetical protein